MRFIRSALAVPLVFAVPAGADVTTSSEYGFVSRNVVEVNVAST